MRDQWQGKQKDTRHKTKQAHSDILPSALLVWISLLWVHGLQESDAES